MNLRTGCAGCDLAFALEEFGESRPALLTALGLPCAQRLGYRASLLALQAS